MTATSLEELAERANDLAEMHKRVPPLDVARALCNEAGVQNARRALSDALDVLGNAQLGLRAAQEAERVAREEHDYLLSEIEWELDARFVASGNKVLLDGEKAMTADERAKWRSGEARKDDRVVAAAGRLNGAEQKVAACKDEVRLAEARLQACRHDLDAAVAVLQALTLALPVRGNGDG